MMTSRNAVSFMHSRLLYAKTEPKPVSPGCFFHTPSFHLNSISRRDKPIHVSLSRPGDYSLGARGVCVGGSLLQKFNVEGVRAEP